VNSILDGKESILSLGESRSDAMGKLIDSRFASHKGIAAVDNIDSVDILFDPAKKPNTPSYAKKYPKNYHGQYFQELNLRNPDGTRKMYDEIFSSWAFDFIAQKAPEQEVRTSLLRVLSHLKKDGSFKVWPMGRSGFDRLKPYLEHLKSDG